MTALALVIGYLVLLLLLGSASNLLFRGTQRDYALASHSIGPVLLLLSLFGTTMTAFALVGSTGRAHTLGVGVYGLLASASGIVHSLCFFLIGVPLWRLGRRHGFVTQVEFFRRRLESPGFGLALFPVLVGLVIPYLLVGIIGGGAVLEQVSRGAFRSLGWFADQQFALPARWGSLLVCAVVLVYVFLGGMRGTAWANAFQTTVFMTLGIITFVVIAQGVGGQEGFWASVQAATEKVLQEHPELLSRERIPKPIYASFLLIPLSVGMFPHIFQHWLTARRASAFRLPIVMHPIFIMVVWAPCVMIGVWATTSAAGLPPQVHENQVLAQMVARFAPAWLSGLLTAGILAAIMSSLDSQFLALGTMFTNDIVLYYFGPQRFSERQKVWLARAFVALVVAVSYALSLFPHRAVFDMGLWCFSGFTALVPLVLAALYWRGLSRAGAWASLLSTVLCWSVLFWRSHWGANKLYAFPEPWMYESSWGWLVRWIPPLHPVVSITAASTVALVVVSLLTRPVRPQVLQQFFGPESPRQDAAKASGVC